MSDNKDVHSIEYIKNSDIEILENDIFMYIHEYCSNFDIDDIKIVSQSVWNGCMSYICKTYIKPSKILKKQGDIHNSYDIDFIDSLADFYIYLCQVYDKECSLYGFSNLTGIQDTLFLEWENNYNGRYDMQASPKRSELAKKIRSARENSLSDKLLNGKNPVGVLGILNHFYGWNMPGVKESATKSAGTLADLQKKAGLLSDNSAAVPDDLAENRIVELSDNLTQKKSP